MNLAHHILSTCEYCYDMADALQMAWQRAKRGQWPVNADELEGQRSEHAYNQYKASLMISRGF